MTPGTRQRIAEARRTGAEELDLGGLGLIAIPDELFELAQLKTLYLGLRAEVAKKYIYFRSEEEKKACNALSTIPPAFFTSLGHLSYLHLEHNQLGSLPEAIDRLTCLLELSLDHNRLESLPEAIGQLTSLQVLSLRSNQLVSLPTAISQLARLRKLRLNDNRLESLPEAIGQLTALEQLFLFNNQLERLPETVGQLTALKSLCLGINRLVSLPDAFGELAMLDVLFLDNNRLVSLPNAIGKLTSLEWLDLGNNRLVRLPGTISGLTRLIGFSLAGNCLSELPSEMGNLAELERPGDGRRGIGFDHRNRGIFSGVDLAGNPLQTPPAEVVAQGTKAISAYLRDLGKTSEPLYEAKIVLVGEGAVGKTTLKERLIRNHFKTPESTRGLEMEAAPRPHPA